MTNPGGTAVPAQPLVPPAGGRRGAGLLIVVLIVLCLLFVGGYVQRLAEKAAVEAQIVAMEQQIQEARVRNAILGKELAQVNDEAHIAAIARDALNLVQEGDQLITIVDARPAAAGADSPAAAPMRSPVNTTPTWQRWLDLLLPLD